MEFKRCECGKPLPLSGWLFCQMCGKRLPEMRTQTLYAHFKHCERCNFIISNTDSFCINCGKENEYMKKLKERFGT